jgi:hypothetical protein
VWAVLVFDGNEVEFAPELHGSRKGATDAAERWAWILTSNGELPVRQRGESEWLAGFRQIIVAPIEPGFPLPQDPWIGLSWDEGCFPSPSVELVDGLRQSADWVGSAAGLTQLVVSPWAVASGHMTSGSLRRAVASRAKVVNSG